MSHFLHRPRAGSFAAFCTVWISGIAAGYVSGQDAARVPPEVAIPRPSEAEIALARQSLERFIATASPSLREVLEKYPDLVAVRPPRLNTAIVPNLSRFFQEKHGANLEVARAGDIDVLFMGDSITEFWRRPAGQPVFDEYFGHMKVANFGVAGDTTQGVLYRLQNGEGQGFSPKAVMLLIGTNNTRANTADEIAEGIGAVVLELEKDFPDARILLLAVFPRGRAGEDVRDIIAEINSRIARLDDHERVFYLDIGHVFLDENGEIPTDVMGDRLHPASKGYELWAEAVKEPLRRLIGDS